MKSKYRKIAYILVIYVKSRRILGLYERDEQIETVIERDGGRDCGTESGKTEAGNGTSKLKKKRKLIRNATIEFKCPAT